MQYPWAVVGARVTPTSNGEWKRGANTSWWHFWKADRPLVGTVYQITKVVEMGNGTIGLVLAGMSSAYSIHGFRPVRHVNTDATMADLRELVRDARLPERVRG